MNLTKYWKGTDE